jgi:hypothetical protein
MSKAKSIQIIIALTIIGGLCTACSSPQPELPKTESPELNKMLEVSPYSIVDLDAVAMDTLWGSKSNRLGINTDPALDEKVLLSQVVGVMKLDKNLYVADGTQNCIWKMNSEGIWVDKIGRKGRGPGEFRNIMGLTTNGNRIFVNDANNAEVDVFDTKLKYLESFHYQSLFADSKNFAATQEHLYTPMQMGGQKLLRQFSAQKPYRMQDSLINPIIPFPEKPMAYNLFDLDGNKQGDFVMAFQGLPYLFLFDSQLNQSHTIYLTSEHIDSVENPTVEPQNGSNNPLGGLSVNPVLHDLFLLDDGTVMVAVDSRLYRLRRDGDRYNLTQASLVMFDQVLQKDREYAEIPFTELEYKDNELYVYTSHDGFIYRFDYPQKSALAAH